MAFIFQSTRQIDVLQKYGTPINLGPGSYKLNLSQKKTVNIFPFNSSQTPQNKIKQLYQSPGPGQYAKQETQLNFNDIINQNESSYFKSPIPRMSFKQDDIPGPGSYQREYQKQAQNSENKRVQYARQNRIITQSIPNIRDQKCKNLQLGNIENYQQRDQNMEKDNSQTIYQNNRYENNNSQQKIGSWSQYTGAKIENCEKKTTNQKVGPGSYDLQPYKRKQSSMSVFKSQSQRINDQNQGQISQKIIIDKFQNQLKLQSNNSQIQDINQEMMIDIMQKQYIEKPGPGYYFQENSKVYKKNNEKFQFFGSASLRCIEKQQNNQSIQYESQNKIKKQKNNFNKDERWDNRKIKESLGPGFYDSKQNMQHDIIKKVKQGYQGNFGSQQKRLFQKSNHQNQPGPGTYMPITVYKKKVSKFEPIQTTLQDQQNISNEQSTDINNSLKINLSKQDINQNTVKKQKKTKKQIPFLANDKRFKKKSMSEKNIENISIQQIQDQNNKDYQQSKRKKKNFDKQKRFIHDDKDKIGPGEYIPVIYKELNKKSFNVNFL